MIKMQEAALLPAFYVRKLQTLIFAAKIRVT